MSENEGEPGTCRPSLGRRDDSTLTARLMRNPRTRGLANTWLVLLNIGRFREAAEAYARAIELDPDIAELRGDRIEAWLQLQMASSRLRRRRQSKIP